MADRLPRDNRTRRARAAALAVLAALGAALPLQSASAQGLFNFLFGRRPQSAPPVQASPPPLPGPVSRGDPTGPRITHVPGGDTGRSVAYCVRTCDGRYFPLQRLAGTSPAEVCRAFCPAAETKVYNGSLIDHAVASDGTRYTGLKTAFLYRTRLVAGCTCNGRDPFGLARIDAKSDPTLRSGDIVATEEGFQVYSGARGGSGSLTPINSYAGLSQSMREQLSAVKITPAAPRTVAGPSRTPLAEARNAPPGITGSTPHETTGVALRDELRLGQGSR